MLIFCICVNFYANTNYFLCMRVLFFAKGGLKIVSSKKIVSLKKKIVSVEKAKCKICTAGFIISTFAFAERKKIRVSISGF